MLQGWKSHAPTVHPAPHPSSPPPRELLGRRDNPVQPPGNARSQGSLCPRADGVFLSPGLSPRTAQQRLLLLEGDIKKTRVIYNFALACGALGCRTPVPATPRSCDTQTGGKILQYFKCIHPLAAMRCHVPGDSGCRRSQPTSGASSSHKLSAN